VSTCLFEAFLHAFWGGRGVQLHPGEAVVTAMGTVLEMDLGNPLGGMNVHGTFRAPVVGDVQ
jgi:hypothetical protein